MVTKNKMILVINEIILVYFLFINLLDNNKIAIYPNKGNAPIIVNDNLEQLLKKLQLP